MKTVVTLFFILFWVIMPSSVMAVESDSSLVIPDLLSDEFEEEGDFDTDFMEDDNSPLVHDPLEPMNRAFFEINDFAYEWVFSPFVDGYMYVMPHELRECFRNFFENLASPVRFLNSLLQGELKQSGVVLGRFLINSTIGVYGLVDVAFLEFEMEPQDADFGQTLGRWGVGQGVYLFWPIIGPSSTRDSLGLVVDAYTHPIPYFHESRVLDLAYYSSNKLNDLSLNRNVYDDLKKYSLDPYVASRQAYYDYRQNLVERHK